MTGLRSSTGPLASPKSPAGHNFISLKDFTCGHWNDVPERFQQLHAETMPVDARILQFVYQGFDKTVQSSDYGLIPYRMALLTLHPLARGRPDRAHTGGSGQGHSGPNV